MADEEHGGKKKPKLKVDVRKGMGKDELLVGRKERSERRVAALRDTLGDGAVRLASHDFRRVRIPTGSFRLDWATGGGLPIGRTHTFWGMSGGGKTTAALRVVGQAQRFCCNCYRYPVIRADGTPYCDCYQKRLVQAKQLPDELKGEFTARIDRYMENSFEPVMAHFADVEGDLDEPWAVDLGVIPEQLTISEHESGEEVVDVVEALIQGGDTDIVVVDSLAMMTPTAELERSAENKGRGEQPLLVNMAMRKWTQARVRVRREHGRIVTVLLINQARQKMDNSGYGGPQVQKPGGMGQKFAGSVEVYFWEASGDVEDIKIDSVQAHNLKRANTAISRFRTDKNKTAGTRGVTGEIETFVRDVPPFRRGQVNDFPDIWRLCRKAELVRKQEKPNKWFLWNEEFGTEKAAKEYLLSNPDFERRLRAHLAETLMQMDF
jgi:RecA/RadA recombinase